MKKRRKKKTRVITLLFMLCFAFILISKFVEGNPSDILNLNKSFTNVKKYEPLIHDELKQYHMEKYTPVLVALMQQESRGKGGDPMQASESAGLARNTIQDPKESIRVGVKHFRRAVIYGKQRKVDFPTIIQAYNMGTGYIDYVAEHGGRHSEELAKKFSLQQVKKNPTIYNCGGNKFNFRYPYCYGDYTYSTKVSRNIQSLAESVPAAGSQKSLNF
ncbi:lysozyme family protein [Bacillus xiapuensis]|uniref:Lysozyme family protein n=1 Tax=Bacillus xiapuensis TaxID=2014075 RepID=A0ABU6NDN6_9BACI|nr:lysozyme family protein [Bacillus xiapuensis]